MNQQSLYNIISKAKESDPDSLELLINKFDPIISKLSYKLSYDCAKSDLIIFFINFLKNIKLTNINLINDGVMVNYIKTSLYREYYRLNSKNNYVNETELYDTKYFFESLYNEIEFSLLLSELVNKRVITKKQKKIIELKCIYNLTDQFIGEQLNISRQAVNKTYNSSLISIGKILKKEVI